MSFLAHCFCLKIISSGNNNTTSTKNIEIGSRPKCVPLPHCKTLHWIWRHREELPDITKSEVEEYVFSLNCGIQVNRLLINDVNLWQLSSYMIIMSRGFNANASL